MHYTFLESEEKIMKRKISFLVAVFLMVFTFGTMNVKADNLSCPWKLISVDGTYLYSTKPEIETGTVDGVTLDEESMTLTINNATMDKLSFTNVPGITVVLKGNSVVNNYVWIDGTKIKFIGDGNLEILSKDVPEYLTSFYIQNSECSDYDSDAEIAIDGTITSNSGVYSRSPFKLADNVKIKEGGQLRERDGWYYIAEEDAAIPEGDIGIDSKILAVARPTKVVLDGRVNKKLEAGTTTFESKTEIPEGYELKVEDKLSSLSKDDTKKITDHKASSTLLILSDVSVYDAEGEVVEMKDGEFTIRFKLTEEQLSTYDNFIAVYVKDGKVVEEFATKVDGEYVEFTTTHLSEYGILGIKKAEGEKNPATGDTLLYLIALLTIGIVISSVAIKYMRKVNNN